MRRFTKSRRVDSDEQLAPLLVERLSAAAPEIIAINRGGPLAAADGLSATDYEWLVDVLGPEMSSKLVPSASLVERFLGSQLDVEMPLFAESARLSVTILTEVLSDRVVVAAGTSVQDLVWAVRGRATALGSTWRSSHAWWCIGRETHSLTNAVWDWICCCSRAICSSCPPGFAISATRIATGVGPI